MEWTKHLAVKVSAQEIYKPILKSANALDKPGFRSKYRVENMDID